MATTYPTSKQTFTTHVDNDASDLIDAEDINPVQDTVAALEDACGYGTTFPTLPGAIWKDWTPSYSASGSMTYTSVSTYIARYTQIGKIVFFQLTAKGTTGGTADTAIRFTLPVTPAHTTDNAITFGACCWDTSAEAGTCIWDNTNSALAVQKYDRTNWGLGINRQIAVSGAYERS